MKSRTVNYLRNWSIKLNFKLHENFVIDFFFLTIVIKTITKPLNYLYFILKFIYYEDLNFITLFNPEI